MHLGRPIRALSLHPHLAPERFARAAERALKNLVEVCLTERASLLLIAGDLIDHWRRDYQLGLRLLRGFQRAEHSGTLVFWVRGNHDAENRVIRNLLLPVHVRELGLDGVQTVRLEHAGVNLVGRSYPKRCTETNLFAEFPAPDPGALNIGMLHTSADGMTTGDRYAPCGRRELVSRGYQYLALGHVHEPEIRRARCPSLTRVVFMRAAFSSLVLGCLRVTFNDKGVRALTHQPLGRWRFGKLTVELDEARTLDQVLERVQSSCRAAVERAGEVALVVRVCIAGERGLETLHACASGLRHRALRNAAESVSERLSIDGFWAEPPCDGAPSIRLDDEALVQRRDV